MLKKNIDYKIISDFVFFRDSIQVLEIENTDLKDFLVSNNKMQEYENANEISNYITNIIKTNKQPSFAELSAYPSITMNLTSQCNLNCSYCFAYKEGENNKIDIEKAKESINWLIRENKNKRYSILFFGGEPLLMLPLIKEIVEFCNNLMIERNIQIYFSITTNGTIINDEIIKLFKQHNFHIKISMDGPKDINDNNRKYWNGKGSFDDIYSNLKLLKKNDIPFEIRTTISPDSVNIIEIINFFEDKKIHFGFDFVLLPKYKEANGNYSKQVLDKVKNEFRQLIDYYHSKIINKTPIYCANILTSLSRILFQQGKKIACDAGVTSFTVNADGSLYSCQNISNIRKTSIGNVTDGIVIAKRDDFLPKSVEDMDACKECIYKYLCSGACMADKYINNNNTTTPVISTCLLREYYWDSMLELYYIIFKKYPKYFKELKELNEV